ncbi:hypothetical protein BGW80DRAFT_1469325 [Lactifluus volemus]|nr:hypothetical protein BGW80DRAFT_1469325 [Lactifluus volemus]
MAEIQVAKPPKGKSKWQQAALLRKPPHNYNAKAKTKEATIFYSEVTRAFIERFGYNLGYGENLKDDQEVKDLGPMPVATFPEEEQAAEHERRDEYYTELRQKLSAWYRNNCKAQPEQNSKQTVAHIIEKFVSSGRLQPPRKQKIVDKYYNLEWENKLKDRFDEWKVSNPQIIAGSELLKEQNIFVNRALAEEGKDYNERLKARVDESHQSRLATWKKNLDSTKAAYTENDTSENAWEMAKEFLPILADALGDWVGGVVVITAAMPHEGKLHLQNVQSVSEGRVKESISERFTREWNDYLQAVKRYGMDYFKNDIRLPGDGENPKKDSVTARLGPGPN